MDKIALIVDDQENWRDSLKRFLIKLNFKVEDVATLVEAKEKINQQNFDLAVFDARLKDDDTLNLDGIELLEVIKEKQPNVRTILISDYPESISEHPDKLEENPPKGADAFMYKVPKGKSFDKHKFNETIKRLFCEE